MKILIAYDGSSCSDSALDDLQKAGLPDTADALILSVAETWLPPPPDNQDLREYADFLQTEPQPFKAYRKGGRLLSEAEAFAKHAEKRLKQNFPNWEVSAETSYGSPAWEILTAASNFGANLIVVGSQGRTALGRIWLGSISTRVLTEANQSVRVARGRVEVDPSPTRIVIGFDGSEGSRAAVDAVLVRNWPPTTEVRLIAATNHVLPAAIGRFVEPIADWVDNELKAEREWIENIADGELKKLNAAAMKATLRTCAGNPKQVLIEEAQEWGADCIFVGATASPGRVERFLLGSTAAAVAERAPCSVEVIRNDLKPISNSK